MRTEARSEEKEIGRKGLSLVSGHLQNLTGDGESYDGVDDLQHIDVEEAWRRGREDEIGRACPRHVSVLHMNKPFLFVVFLIR